MKKFNLVQQYKGYVNKKDVTNLDPEYLVAGSQNVLINDGEKIGNRPGYTLFGAASSVEKPPDSSYEWLTSTGTEIALRKAETTLEFYYNSAWNTLSTGFAATSKLQFAEWYDSTTEKKDFLLMVDGTSNMYAWSGGITTFASATANTITKQGTNTWAQDRFLLAGTRTVIIEGVTYTYTGGESTTTLTGVTPDPTAGGHTAGDVVVQGIRTTANTPASGVNNNLISTLKNQIYVADLTKRDVYVSKTTDYTSFTFTTPVRAPGEGALLTLDSNPVAFAIQDNEMYVSGSKNDWYRATFTLSADLTKETLKIEKLKSGSGQGAYSQSAIGQIKNEILYFNNDKTIDTLGRVENINTPESRPISDSIKSELLDSSIDIEPHIKFYKSKTYIVFPSDSKILIYDHEKGYWQPPQILPVRRLAIIGGELYGHSNRTTETYKIFDSSVWSDNGNPILAIAAMAYRNYDYPAWKKNFDEFFVEGYISSNTKLSTVLKYEFGGYSSILEKIVDGSNDKYIVQTVTDGSLGKNPIGSQPLGTITDSPSNMPKFRTIFEIAKQDDWFEMQVQYQSNDIDYQWEVLRSGGNITTSTEDNFDIKQ